MISRPSGFERIRATAETGYSAELLTYGLVMLGRLKDAAALQRQRYPTNARQSIELLALGLAHDEIFVQFAIELLAIDGRATADVDVRSLDNVNRWQLARAVRGAILTGQVRPEYTEQRDQPKPNGNGTRTITMYRLSDKVIQRVLSKIASAVADDLLPDEQIGSRADKNRRELIRVVETAVADGKTCMAKADLRQAFDNVPLSRAFQQLPKYVGRRFADRIQKSLWPEQDAHGLPQGHSSSPLVMNAYGHRTILSKLLDEFPDVAMVQYVDDFLAIGDSISRLTAFWQRLRDLSRTAGFALKAPLEESVCDLRTVTKPFEGLGYGFQIVNCELQVVITESSFQHLQAHLVELHDAGNAPFRAEQIISGWLTESQPCLAPQLRDQHVDRIVQCLRSAALSEWPDRNYVAGAYDEVLSATSSLNRGASRHLDAPNPPTADFHVFMHCFLPRSNGTPQSPESVQAGWAWIVTDNDYAIVDHGHGVVETNNVDELRANCLEEIAASVASCTPVVSTVTLVQSSGYFAKFIAHIVDRNGAGNSTEGSPYCRIQRAGQRLAQRDLRFDYLRQKDVTIANTEIWHLLARTVSFWARQAVVEAELCVA